MYWSRSLSFFFFFNDTATTEIYTLSLHDALPICAATVRAFGQQGLEHVELDDARLRLRRHLGQRSEEHTSELQSQSNLVCRLLLEKKNKKPTDQPYPRIKRHRDSITSIYSATRTY